MVSLSLEVDMPSHNIGDTQLELRELSDTEIDKMMRVVNGVADLYDDVTPLELTDIFLMLGVPDNHPELNADLVAEVYRIASLDENGNVIKRPRKK